MIQPYFTDYFPPFPVLDVTLAIPLENDWIGPFTMIIDSGADITIIPITLLGDLKLPVERTARIRISMACWPNGNHLPG